MADIGGEAVPHRMGIVVLDFFGDLVRGVVATHGALFAFATAADEDHRRLVAARKAHDVFGIVGHEAAAVLAHLLQIAGFITAAASAHLVKN